MYPSKATKKELKKLLDAKTVKTTCPISVRTSPTVGRNVFCIEQSGVTLTVVAEKDGWLELADGCFVFGESVEDVG